MSPKTNSSTRTRDAERTKKRLLDSAESVRRDRFGGVGDGRHHFVRRCGRRRVRFGRITWRSLRLEDRFRRGGVPGVGRADEPQDQGCRRQRLETTESHTNPP